MSSLSRLEEAARELQWTAVSARVGAVTVSDEGGDLDRQLQVAWRDRVDAERCVPEPYTRASLTLALCRRTCAPPAHVTVRSSVFTRTSLAAMAMATAAVPLRQPPR